MLKWFLRDDITGEDVLSFIESELTLRDEQWREAIKASDASRYLLELGRQLGLPPTSEDNLN